MLTTPDDDRYRNAFAPRKPVVPPPLRALTLQRPWSAAIVRGPKRVENRTWFPPAMLLGHTIAIHAGLTYDDHLSWPDGWSAPADPPVGIVGVARLLGAATREGSQRIQTRLPGRSIPLTEEERARIKGRLLRIDEDPWANRMPGTVWWLLGEPIAIEPVHCKGSLGLWTVDPMIAADVRRRVEKARGATA